MSVAFLINPVTTISRFHYSYSRNRVLPVNLGFLNNKDSVNAFDLKIQVTPKSRFLKSLHKVCQCCLGFSSFGAKLCASSSTSSINFSINFNIKDTGEYEKNTGLEQNEALNIGGSDTSFGGGGGPGGQGNGGGRTGTNDDSGRLGGSADWEKVKGCCWWLLDTWKYHYQLAHPSSSSVLLLFSRFVMPIVEELVGNGAQDLEGLLMRLLMAIFYPMFVLIPIAFSGFTAALEQMMLLLAAGVLGFVLVALFLFAKFYLHML